MLAGIIDVVSKITLAIKNIFDNCRIENGRRHLYPMAFCYSPYDCRRGRVGVCAHRKGVK